MSDWYVSPSGNDSTGDGSSGTPWLTVATALGKAALVPGDRVYMRAGTLEGWTCTKNNITFEGYPGEVVIVSSGTRNPDLIRFQGVSQGKLRNLTITQQNATTNSCAVKVLDCVNAPGVTVERCRVIDNPQFAIRAYNSNYITVIDNELARSAKGVEIHADSIAGIEVNRGYGSVIARNWVHDINAMIKNTPASVSTSDDFGAQGISFTRVNGTPALPILVEDNVVERCFAVSYDYGYDGSCVELFASSWITIRNNIFRDSKNVAETGTQNPHDAAGITIAGTTRLPMQGITFTRNRCSTDPTHPSGTPPLDYARGLLLAVLQSSDISHNTFSGFDQFCVSVSGNPVNNPYQGAFTNVTIRNNIFVAGPRATVDRCINFWEDLGASSNVIVDHNLYFHPAGATGQIAYVDFGNPKGVTTVAAIQAISTYEDNGIQGDPLLAVGAGLGLRPGSPAIDAAPYITALNSPYRGAGPDLGALEGTLVGGDDFLRTTVNQWSSAPIGGAWTVSSAIADYDIDHGAYLGASMDFPTSNATKRARLASVSAQDVAMTVAVRMTLPGAATVVAGASMAIYLVARMLDDTNNMYYARLNFKTDGGIQLGIVRREAGVEAALNVTAAAVTDLARETFDEGQWYWWRFAVSGINPTRLRSKFWRMGTTEPSTWDREGADNTAAFQVPSAIGFRGFATTLITTPLTVFWDRFVAFSDIEGLRVDMTRNAVTAAARQISPTFSGGGAISVPLGRPRMTAAPRNINAAGAVALNVPLARQTLSAVAGNVVPVNVRLVTLGRPTMALSAPTMDLFGVTGATEELVYDSGLIDSTTSDLNLPPGVLDDDQHYRWTVDVQDSEQITGTLS